MPLGPGKYDEALSEALKMARAEQGILIVLDGHSGPSFCCQLSGEFLYKIPGLLRHMADTIEKDNRQGKV